MSYTPGKWEVKLNVGVTLGAEKPKYVIGTGSIWVALTTSEEDANLIAAAPDMYEALKEAIAVVYLARDRGVFGASESLHQLRQALVKAEGK